MVERVIVVHSDRGRPVDGLRDYSYRLADEIRAGSAQVELRIHPAGPRGRGVASSVRAWRELSRWGPETAIVLQYNPFCFARWGFAPWLPASLLAIRARPDRPTLAVMVHEPYVPLTSLRSTAMGLWQRSQLAAIRLAADVVFTSIDTWAERFRRQLLARDVRHLPVGSNLPDARAERRDERDRMGIDGETLVVATLGRDHPSWRGEHVVAALNAIATTGRPVCLLSLGAEAPRLCGLDSSIAVRRPGYLEAGELARKVASSDLFLAPLGDGVSTRRGTVMVALQHGLPVVGTVGPLTDSILRESDAALRLAPVDDRELFARSAVLLAEDRAARELAGTAARELYERNFDWPVIAGRLLAGLPVR